MSNMVIQTNMLSLNAHRNMGITGTDQARASARLSSGFRINTAADDAAGLGISEKMRGQIRGLNQASRNSQDGISLIQTAEGAMQTVNDIVIRVRELVVQAANDTNVHEDDNVAHSDRARIQDEINQLLDEIDQIAWRTEFNTRTLLNGDWAAEASILAPPEGDPPLPPPPVIPTWQNVLSDLFDFDNVVGNGTLVNQWFATANGGNTFTGPNGTAIDGIIGNTPPIPTDREFILRPGLSGDMVATAINNAVNAAIQELVGYNPNDHATFQAAVTDWLHEMGVFTEAGVGATGLYSPDGIQDINQLLTIDNDDIGRIFAATGDEDFMANIAAAREAVLDAISGVEVVTGWIIENPGTAPTVSDAWSFSHNVVQFDAALITDPAAARNAVNAALAAEITNILGGTPESGGSVHSRVQDLLQHLTTTPPNLAWHAGNTALTPGAAPTAANTTLQMLFDGLLGTAVNFAGVTQGNVDTSLPGWEAAARAQHDIVLGNAQATPQNVTVTQTATDGTTREVTIQVTWDVAGALTVGTVVTNGGGTEINSSTVLAGLTDDGVDMRMRLENVINYTLTEGGFFIEPGTPPPPPPPEEPVTTGGRSLWFHIGANESQGVRLHIESVTVESLGLNGLRTVTAGNMLLGGQVPPGLTGYDGVMLESGQDVGSTETGFLSSLDEAMSIVNQQRSILGAVQNRLEFTIQNLDIAAENLQASNSRIRDADMAKEMSRFTQTNVLQQAAISMLAQANQQPQNILQLLR